jgi:hypothetical protein
MPSYELPIPRPRPRRPALAATAFLFALGFAAPLPAATFTVDSQADAVDALPGDALCAAAGGACTLRAAIQETNALAGADEILLPAGTYLLTLPGAGEDAAASGDLDVTGDLTIIGVDGTALTVIDGNGTVTGDRVFHVLDPAALGLTASFSTLTIRGGRVINENGGGLLITTVEGGGPHLGEPGAVGVEMGECVVEGNRAFSNQQTPGGEPIGGSGGGIYAGGPLVATQVEIRGNHADANGGGVYSGAAVRLIGTAVAANHAENGGGMFVTGAAISEVSYSAVVLNTAVGGGGVSSRAQTFLVVTNTTIDGNSATDVGAGINSNGTVSLDRTTVTANRSDSDAPNGGAGLNSFSGGDFRLSNVLLADNVVNALGALPEVRNCGCTGGGGCTPGIQFLSLGYNLENSDSCTFRETTDQPVTEPFLGPLHPLGGPTPVRAVLEDSPAIDAGELASCPSGDQRNFPRPVDGDGDMIADCDIGAFELQVPEWAIFYDSFERGDTSRWSLAMP